MPSAVIELILYREERSALSLYRVSSILLVESYSREENCGARDIKVGSYEDIFPVALVLGGKNPMDHNF